MCRRSLRQDIDHVLEHRLDRDLDPGHVTDHHHPIITRMMMLLIMVLMLLYSNKRSRTFHALHSAHMVSCDSFMRQLCLQQRVNIAVMTIEHVMCATLYSRELITCISSIYR